MRALFAAARRAAPAIVFIDEIDCVGASRERGGERQVHAQTLNALLVEMDGFAQNQGLVVLAATNQVGSLDSALSRPGRFDRIIHVPSPDMAGRRRLLARLAERLPLAEDVSLDELTASTGGMTGAELENMLNQVHARHLRTICTPSARHLHAICTLYTCSGRRHSARRQLAPRRFGPDPNPNPDPSH